MTKFLVTLSFVFVSLVSVRAQQPALVAEVDPESGTWITIAPINAGFTVLMPGKPSETSQPVEGPSGVVHHLIMVETKMAGYVGSYVEFPEVTTDTAAIKEMLDRGREGGIASSKAELISEKEIKLNEFMGREWLMKLPNGLIATARAYWVKRRLYQVIHVTRPNANDSPELIKLRQAAGNKFLDSFTLSGDNVPR